jgi:CoA:oxalate CoA-transferase
LGVVQQGQFESLARLLKRDEWLTDPRFATADLRRANASALQTFLSAAFRERPAEEWEKVMSVAGIPCGMVRDVAQACALPHLEQRGLKIPLTVPGLPTNENIEILNAGFQFLNDGPTLNSPPPTAGQHTEELLRWLEFDEPQRSEILRRSRP